MNLNTPNSTPASTILPGGHFGSDSLTMDKEMLKVLVADDDAGLRMSVSTGLRNAGRFHVTEAVDGLDALERVKEKRFDVVLLDVDMPRMNGIETLRKIKEHDPSIVVLILTAYANIDDAVKTVKEGAYNYLAKPIKSDELIQLIDKAVEAQMLISRVAASSPILMEPGTRFIGNSVGMKKVFTIIDRLSKVDTAVLIRGESGTGKELVARAIHYNSSRKDQKFVAINCSAIPESLFESELFGHEKGSFTGADARKIGKFQFAEGGTLFLDEIGDMPLLMQAKLLRVLQDKTFTPVGSNRELEANVRIIAATNRPLEKMIDDGTFREDLFYRLNVIPIFLPSLRDRKNDIDNLVQSFVHKFNKAHGKKVIGVSPEAMSCLKKYGWPGNIRELENVVEYSFIWETENKISMASLPEKVLVAAGVDLEARTDHEATEDHDDQDESENASDSVSADEGESLGLLDNISPEALDFNKHKEMFEKEFIVKALKTFKGRINQTALHANIPKKTLLRKIEKYGIVAKDYADPKN
jgi:two-component system response regulator HydG